MIRVRLQSEIPIYRQLVTEIKRLIGERKLADGDALPPIRSLASQLDVANNTVARAYQILESDGLIETRGRGGTVVRTGLEPPTYEPDDAFAAVITSLLSRGHDRAGIIASFQRGLEATLGSGSSQEGDQDHG